MSQRRDPQKGETITAKSLSDVLYTGQFRNVTASGMWLIVIGLKEDGSPDLRMVDPKTEIQPSVELAGHKKDPSRLQPALVTVEVTPVAPDVTNEKVIITNRRGESVDVALRLGQLLGRIKDLTDHREALAQAIAHLEELPRVNANPYWREGKYLYLNYPIEPGKPRRREYVGNQPDAIAAAEAAIANHRRQVELMAEYDAVTNDLHHLLSILDGADSAARTAQKSIVQSALTGDTAAPLEKLVCHHPHILED